MNDPHIAALIYKIEHGPSVDYCKADALLHNSGRGHGPIPVLFECYRIRTGSGMPRLDIRFSTSHLMMASTR